MAEHETILLAFQGTITVHANGDADSRQIKLDTSQMSTLDNNSSIRHRKARMTIYTHVVNY